MAAVRILIDTDIGDDVDDALAIALALNSAELEVVGVTTVYQNTRMRAQLALQLLQVMGAEHIPVAVGIEQPIRNRVDSTVIPHQCRNMNATYPSNCNLHAVDLIIETLRKDPDTVLVPIGPFTNIAIAAKLAPELIASSRIVAMGGAFGSVYPEYNIMCDPEAANIVLSSGARVELVGLDVTVQCQLSKEDIDKIYRCRGSVERYICSLMDIWLHTSISGKVTLHDPLTVAYLADSSLLRMESVPVAVEMDGGITRGLTAVLRTPFRQRQSVLKDNALVAREVDARKMRDTLMNRVFNLA